jgi:hypothetical protein
VILNNKFFLDSELSISRELKIVKTHRKVSHGVLILATMGLGGLKIHLN